MTAMAEEKPKIRWQTYAVAACWAVFLIGMSSVAPSFNRMFQEMGCFGNGSTAARRPFTGTFTMGTKDMALPLSTRMVVRVPVAMWIVLGLLVPICLVGKSKLLCQKTGDLIDKIAFVVLFGVVAAVVIALFRPLIVLMESIEG